MRPIKKCQLCCLLQFCDNPIKKNTNINCVAFYSFFLLKGKGEWMWSFAYKRKKAISVDCRFGLNKCNIYKNEGNSSNENAVSSICRQPICWHRKIYFSDANFFFYLDQDKKKRNKKMSINVRWQKYKLIQIILVKVRWKLLEIWSRIIVAGYIWDQWLIIDALD